MSKDQKVTDFKVYLEKAKNEFKGTIVPLQHYKFRKHLEIDLEEMDFASFLKFADKHGDGILYYAFDVIDAEEYLPLNTDAIIDTYHEKYEWDTEEDKEDATNFLSEYIERFNALANLVDDQEEYLVGEFLIKVNGEWVIYNVTLTNNSEEIPTSDEVLAEIDEGFFDGTLLEKKHCHHHHEHGEEGCCGGHGHHHHEAEEEHECCGHHAHHHDEEEVEEGEHRCCGGHGHHHHEEE